MTKTQFIEHYKDQITGMLMRPFTVIEMNNRLADKGWADLGKAMRRQQEAAERILGEMYDALKPQELLKVNQGKRTA